jgi:hypothetical protein
MIKYTTHHPPTNPSVSKSFCNVYVTEIGVGDVIGDDTGEADLYLGLEKGEAKGVVYGFRESSAR